MGLDFQKIEKFAHEILDQTGEIIRPYFRSGMAVARKEDESPVTVADTEVEEIIRAKIMTEFPDFGFCGEESGEIRADAEYVWHIDPIDGTKAFIMGIPLFGTLLGLAHHGKPVFGALDQPYIRDRWIGIPGRGCWLNGAEVRTSGCEDLKDAKMSITSPDYLEKISVELYARAQKIEKIAKEKAYGISCYGSGLLAMGSVDLVISGGLKSWDYMARIAICEAAGGVMTDWEGQMPRGHGVQVVAAASPLLHQAALEYLSFNSALR